MVCVFSRPRRLRGSPARTAFRMPVLSLPSNGPSGVWSMRTWVAASSSSVLRGRERGGFRLLVGFGSHRSVFLFGFAKNERENIEEAELKTLREIAGSFLKANDEQIAQALKDGTLIEVQHGNENKWHNMSKVYELHLAS